MHGEDDGDEAAYTRAVTMFGNAVRQQVLRHLLEAGVQNQSQISEGTGVHSTTVTRQLIELEHLGVVRADLPRGVRQGRSANFRLDVDSYTVALRAWIARMSPEGF